MVQTGNLRDVMIIDVVSTRADRVPPTPAVKEPDSYIKWGASSQFNYDDNFRDYAVSVEDVTPAFPFQGEWIEEGRKYSDFRVENPEDKDQYVIVQKLEAVAFSGPDIGTHKLNQNPHPQVVMSFKNDNNGTHYQNSQGEEFEPICLDPFHTIIDAVWKKGDFAIVAIRVGPNGSGSFNLKISDPTDIVLGTENPIYEGSEELFKSGASGAMADPTGPDTFRHPEAMMGNHMVGDRPDPVLITPFGTTPVWPFTEYTKVVNGNLYSLLVLNHPADPGVIGLFAGGTSNGVVNQMLLEHYNIPMAGADGYVWGATSDGGGQQWRVESNFRGHVHIYRLYGMPWNERYDAEPYAYAMAMVKNDKLLKALFALMQAQQTPSITLDAMVDGYTSLPAPGDEKSYYGTGKCRVSWYRGNKKSLAAAEKLLAISFTTGGGGPIVIDPGSGGAPQQLYLTPEALWEALRFGQGYIDAGATADLMGAIVTEQEYTFPSGAAVSGSSHAAAKFDINFQTKTYDKQ